MGRGRPRYDDVLTPREWEVLDLLKRGLTNAEIADRLGVTRDTAKFHVSEIITKLGVENREQAASWGGRPRVVFGWAPLAALFGKAAAVSPWKLAAGAGVATAGAGFAALLIGVLMSGNTQSAGVPVDTVQVRWIEEEPPPPVSWEAPRPFADLVPAGTPDVWRAYVVEGNGAPRLLTETNRYLDADPVWDGDSVLLPYSTRQIGSDGVLGTIIHGFTAVDTNSGGEEWDRITDMARSWASSEGGRLAQTVLPGQIYVADPDGTSLKLEGIFPMTTLFWSSNGEYFIAIGEEVTGDPPMPQMRRPFSAYVLTPGDPIGLKLNTAVPGGGSALPRPSPDGSLIMYPEGDSFAIVNVEARTIRRLPIDVRDVVRTAIPAWSADGRYISYGEAVIDVENGTLVRPVTATVGEVTSRVSPGGRWLVVSPSGYFEAGDQPVCPPIQANFAANKTRIVDLQDGSEREVLVCKDMSYSPWYWLDEAHVLMSGYSCRECQNFEQEWVLLDVRDGSSKLLTPDAGSGFSYDQAPDGRLVLGGPHVQILSTNGTPLRSVPSPDGQPVRDVSWSVDGRVFVFVTGPEPDLTQFYRAVP